MKDKNIKQNQSITDAIKSEWINEVINSTSGMAKVSSAPGLHDRIFLKINEPAANFMQLPVKRWVAAAIILMALNIGSVIYYSSRNSAPTENNNSNPLAAELSSVSTYNY